MQARSALFDVYGDHLRVAREPGAGRRLVVRLLDPVGIAAPAVRTAISRMVMQGWLEPVQLAGGRGYRTTARANRRLDEAGNRVYRRRAPAVGRALARWRSSRRPRRAPARSRLRADLSFVGYAELADNVWVSPYPRAELARGARPQRRHRPDRPRRPLRPRADRRLGPGRAARGVRPGGWRPADELVASPPGRATTTPTRRRSRPASTWSTNGASSSSPTPACPTSCSRRTGRAATRPRCSRRRRTGSSRAPTGSSRGAWTPDPPVWQTAAHDRLRPPSVPRRHRRRRAPSP